MSFRDDHDAALERIDALEREAARERARADAAEAELAALRDRARDGDPVPRAAGVHDAPQPREIAAGRVVLGALVLAVIVALVLSTALR